ncbi:MAG: efflux transporter outer membrane subunit [Kofleriaceae bacterium]|nr:efflux transporter outer membrane subunit [Kofleriaceae bacterium]
MKWLAFVALASACAPSTSVTVREVPLPAAYDGVTAGDSIATLDWSAYFADDNLNILVRDALAGNLDLQAELQRIEIARASVQRATGARLPQLSLALGAALHKYGRYTMDGAGNAATEITPGRRVPTHLPDLLVGVQASWEADLWGRLGNLQGAARTRYLASIEGTNLVITNLVADIATAYYQLVALDRMQEVLTETTARQTEALEMMRLEKQAGRTNELAVQQFEAELAGTRALMAATRDQANALENQLNLLAGRTPRRIARTQAALDREVAATVATGVPSDLLRNRPDIRAAELAVAATRFDLHAARAAFYPRLTISANLGYQAFDPRFLLDTPQSIAYGVVAGLVAPLVNRSGIRAAFAAAKATQVEAMIRYQGVVLRGFVEVATDLFRLQRGAEIVEQQRRKKAATTTAVAAADALFRAGKATYLDVLVAQQGTLESELELITALRDQHVASVHLYKALGGGWRGALR